MLCYTGLILQMDTYKFLYVHEKVQLFSRREALRYIYFPCGFLTRFCGVASLHGASPLHPFDTPHSVGLFWTSGQPHAEISTWQSTTLTRDKHSCPQRDSNPQSQQTSGRRLPAFDTPLEFILLLTYLLCLAKL